MSVGAKSAVLLAVTLALGVLIGLAGAGSLERQRRGQLGGLGRPLGFAAHMEEVISPRDGAQGDRVRPIIARAAERNQRLIREANESLRRSIDSMKTELDPLLDESQRRHLDDATRGFPGLGPMGRGGRGGRGGPPSFGPPPDRPPPD